MTVAKLLDAVEAIRPILIENAQKAEVERVPTAAVYQAMYNAELFAMLAPRRHGGFELHPTECMRVWEAVARIDASAAWNLVMNQGIANYAAWLPEAGRFDDHVSHHLEPAAQIIPDRDAEFVTRFGETEESVTAVSSDVAPCSRADLAPRDLTANVIF